MAYAIWYHTSSGCRLVVNGGFSKIFVPFEFNIEEVYFVIHS